MVKKETTDVPEKKKVTNKELEKAIAEINAKYKREAISAGAGNIVIEKISTGLVSIDKLMAGGIPRGRWTMFYGSKGSGKTSLCYKIIALVQEAGGKVVYIDAEHAWDPVYAISLGIDIDSLIMNSPSTIEESMTIIEKLAPLVDLIVLDSIVAVAAEQEMKREMEQDTMALIPRKLSQFFRRVTSIVGKSNAAVILVNQTRTDLGAYVPIDKYPGGNALAHAVSFILKLWRASPKDWPTAKIDGKEEPIGKRIKIRAEKSKISKYEGTDTCFDLLNDEPHFDEYTDMLLSAEMLGLVVNSGAWFQTAVTGEEKYQGRDKVLELLRNDDKVFNALKEKVMETKETGVKEEVETNG